MDGEHGRVTLHVPAGGTRQPRQVLREGRGRLVALPRRRRRSAPRNRRALGDAVSGDARVETADRRARPLGTEGGILSLQPALQKSSRESLDVNCRPEEL